MILYLFIYLLLIGFFPLGFKKSLILKSFVGV